MSYEKIKTDVDLCKRRGPDGEYWFCVNCKFQKFWDEIITTLDGAIVHLCAHLKEGHKVPRHVIARFLFEAEANKIKLNGKQVDIITLKSSTAECEKCNQDANYLIVEPDYTVWYWCGRCSEEK